MPGQRQKGIFQACLFGAQVVNRQPGSLEGVDHRAKIEDRFADFIIEEKLIVECDGLYWDSDAINTNKYYHRDKRKLYLSHNYIPLFFRENEINNQLHIIESMILHKLNLSTKKFARKCILAEVHKKTAKRFLDKHHLMGNGAGNSFGLYDDLGVLSIIQVINKKNHIEISRFCTRLNHMVVGGFSKLLHHINKIYNKPIHTFIDNRYGNGNYLSTLGFNKVNEDISFAWTKNGQVLHRMSFPGNTGYDYGYYKIWDCGQAKFIVENKQ